MRAEEGDETVEDYAAEGEQALKRIETAQDRSDGLFGKIARRFAKLRHGRPGS